MASGVRRPLIARWLSLPRRLLVQGPLARQMLIAICGLFLVVMLFSQAVMVRLFAIDAVHRVDKQASLIMATMEGVREYTAVQVEPIISPLNGDGDSFRAQGVPSYAAQAVFENVNKNQLYSHYSYKEPALNPMNIDDLATDDERRIIAFFQANPSLSKVSGQIRTRGELIHYFAEPLRVNSNSCLVCHSTPERAPASLVARYGRNHGFGWKLNDLIGIQLVQVPLQSIQIGVRRTILAATLGLLLALIILAMLTNAILDKILLAPMRCVSHKANEASLDPTAVEFDESRRSDEIGELAKSLERMRQSLLIAMRMLKG
jgi:HAMP domain-containing protein